MSKIDLLGWLAAVMVLVTFYLKTMTPLRVVAIGSNVLFIFFGLLSQTLPIMVLHCLLLPLNVWRLVEMQQKRKWAHCNSINDLSKTLLLPLMKKGRAPRGSLVFSKGERADEVYFLLSGEIRLRHGNTTVQAGQLLGLMGVFSTDHRRTDTAECSSDVEFAVINAARFREIVDQHPRVGTELIRTIVRRQLGSQEATGLRPVVGSRPGLHGLAAAEAAGSGAWTASTPCFSPDMSMLSPPLKITYMAMAEKAMKPTTSFHMGCTPEG